jgi:uncharacterized protein (DUF1330 family)
VNITSRITFAAIGGMALGAAAVGALNAQVKPPAYVIIEQEVTDPETFNKVFSPQAPPTIEAFGGRYIARGGQTAVLDGEAPKRIVILAFPSLDAAKAWRFSPIYSELAKIRDKAAKVQSYAVEIQGN